MQENPWKTAPQQLDQLPWPLSAFCDFCLRSPGPRLGALILLLLIVDLSAFSFIIHDLDKSGYRHQLCGVAVEAAFVGCVIGQLICLGIVSGCYGRSWLSGMVLSAFIVVTTGMMFFYMQKIENQGSSSPICDLLDSLYFFAYLPIVVLLSGLPFLLMRYYFGWQLTSLSEVQVTRERFSLEDIIALGSVIASAIVFARNASLLQNVQTESQSDLVVLCCFGFVLPVIGVAFTLPTLGLIFHCRSQLQRYLGLGFLFFLALALSICLLVLFGSKELHRGDRFYGMLIYISVAGATSMLLLFVMKWIGLRVGPVPVFTELEEKQVEGLPTVHGNVDPFAEDASDLIPNLSSGASRRTRLVFRLQLGCILAIVGSSGLAVARGDYKKAVEVQSQSDLAKLLEADGVTVETDSEGHVTQFALGPNADDEDLKRLGRFPRLKSLSLAHSRVTDRGIEKLGPFSELTELNVSDTSLTDECLGALVILSMSDYSQIDIHGTEISAHGLLESRVRRSCCLVVSPKQFTVDEMIRLKAKHEVVYSED